MGKWLRDIMQYQGGKSIVSRQIAEIISSMGANVRYQGGKSKSARPIATQITRGGANDYFVSLFCGACSVESKVTGFKNIICNDIHEYLIAMLKGVQSGYELPEEITEEQWRYIKDHKDEDKVLTGFAGFGCSFGGRFFQGYARDNRGYNYALGSKRSLLKDINSLINATFICKDYRDVELPYGCVIYADPPYDGTKEYAGQKFDSNAFWEYMRKISKDHIVFISEQNAPDDFIAIWEKEVGRKLDVNKQNQFKATEKLFVYKDNLAKLNDV